LVFSKMRCARPTLSGMAYRTCWSTDKHVLASLVSNWIDKALHMVQRLITLESSLAEAVHFFDLNHLSSGGKSSNFGSGYCIFFKFLEQLLDQERIEYTSSSTS